MSQVSARRVTILGSTGSIGTQALDVIGRNRDRFTVVALAATGRQPELLADQVEATGAATVAIAQEEAVDEVRAALADRNLRDARLVVGDQAAAEVAGLGADVVLNGLAGAAGLPATLVALKAGTVLALANKESLIIAGPLVKRLAQPDQIVPVDSEHSALAQALRGGSPDEVAKLILTASGGPFRGRRASDLAGVTPEQALAHPTWSMGPLVTINSSTLVNKGLEIIEAHLLFDIDMERIEAVVHPQSIVHSMVEFTDGSTMAQVSPPDMRLPIALGLTWPDRLPDSIPALDWAQASRWDFEPIDHEAFPAVNLARRVGDLGGTAPAVFNAANEAAVARFIAGDLGYLDIAACIEGVLGEHLNAADSQAGAQFVPSDEIYQLEDVLAADAWARQRAASWMT